MFVKFQYNYGRRSTNVKGNEVEGKDRTGEKIAGELPPQEEKTTSIPWKYYSSPTHPERKPFKDKAHSSKYKTNRICQQNLAQRMEHSANCKPIMVLLCKFTGKYDKPMKKIILEKLRNFISIFCTLWYRLKIDLSQNWS